ncbi:MAG: hypothetical protein AAFY03_08650 [Pseudomonadota bacterium]
MEELIQTATEAETSASALKHAERVYDGIRKDIMAIVEDLDGDPSQTPKELRSLLAELRKATLVILHEKQSLEKQRRATAGAVHDYALDLDAARVEVARRLARLSSVYGAEGVSGGSE